MKQDDSMKKDDMKKDKKSKKKAKKDDSMKKNWHPPAFIKFEFRVAGAGN